MTLPGFSRTVARNSVSHCYYGRTDQSVYEKYMPRCTRPVTDHNDLLLTRDNACRYNHG